MLRSIISHVRQRKSYPALRRYASSPKSSKRPGPLEYRPREKVSVPKALRASEDKASISPGKRQLAGAWLKARLRKAEAGLYDALEGHGHRIIFLCINLYIAGHLLMEYVVFVNHCQGASMLPTIHYEGDRVLISMLHRRGRGIKTGDLVSFEHPMHLGYFAIKRVIGMPGDYVLRDTPPQIGQEDEKGNPEDWWMLQVPEGHCWVAGDNMVASRDSRHFGPLPLALIRGKVVGKLWPWKSFTTDQFQPREDVGLD